MNITTDRVLTLEQLIATINKEPGKWILDRTPRLKLGGGKTISNVFVDSGYLCVSFSDGGREEPIFLLGSSFSILLKKNWDIRILSGSIEAGREILGRNIAERSVVRFVNLEKKKQSADNQKEAERIAREARKKDIEEWVQLKQKERDVRVTGLMSAALQPSPGFTGTLSELTGDLTLTHGDSKVSLTFETYDDGCDCCGSQRGVIVRLNGIEVYRGVGGS